MAGVIRKQREATLRTVGLNQKEDSGIPALAERINGSKSPVRTGLLGSLHVQNAA